MYHFHSVCCWKEKKIGIIESNSNEKITVATPPEFGGPPNYWSPEQLFVASIGSCLMSTFLFFVERMNIQLLTYHSKTEAVLEKTRDGLRFTKAYVDMFIEVKEQSEIPQIRNLKSKLEKFCPVSASLNFPITLELKVNESSQ